MYRILRLCSGFGEPHDHMMPPLPDGSHTNCRSFVVAHALYTLYTTSVFNHTPSTYIPARFSSASFMSSSQAARKPHSNGTHGIDALLTHRGKALAVGQQVRFTLIKTASGVETIDPVQPQAPPEAFPVVAKFAESVVKPDFRIFKRFYQQDIPSQKVRIMTPFAYIVCY